MSASALAQENVLLETWGQKLDLTIQSSEMPSTWVLDSKDKQEIMMGWTCCYRQELLDSVRQEHSEKLIGLKSKESQNKSQYTLYESPSDLQIAWFITLQVLDVYTTYRAVKYDCVKETNPLLPNRPTIAEMGLLKSSVIFSYKNWDRKDFYEINSITGMVVLNNNSILNKAQKYCNKF